MANSPVCAKRRGKTVSHPRCHTKLLPAPLRSTGLWCYRPYYDNALLSLPQFLLPLHLSLWCSPPHLEAYHDVTYAQVPTRSIPSAICLHHSNPSDLFFAVTPSSPTPSPISRSPQGQPCCLLPSQNLPSAVTVCTTEPLPPSASGTLGVPTAPRLPRGTH